MGKKWRYFLFLTAFLGLQLFAYGQFTSDHPPEPTTAEGPSRTGCGEGDGGEDGGLPPPVGLCLPINDYLLPLFLCGLTLGSIVLVKLQNNGKAMSSFE